MNKKILLSGISILTSLSMMAGGAFAAFTATANNTGNTFGAGTMTLEVNPFSQSIATPAFTVVGALPGNVTDKVIIMHNTGSVAATASKLASITQSGTLSEKLTLQIYNDVDGNGIVSPGDTLQGNAHISDPAWNNIDLGFGLGAGATHQIIARIMFDADADNTFQGATSTFHLNFQINQ